MSFTVFLLFLHLFSLTTATTQTHPYTCETIPIETIASQPVSLPCNRTFVIVLIGDYGCASCYGKLVESIKMIRPTIEVFGLVRVTSRSIIARRQIVTELKKLLLVKEFFFFYTDKIENLGSYTDGIFGQYRVSITPALLVFRPSHVPSYVSFSTLFRQSLDGAYENQNSTDTLKALLAR